MGDWEGDMKTGGTWVAGCADREVETTKQFTDDESESQRIVL